MTHVNSVNFNRQGHIQDTLISPSITYYSQGDVTLVQKPVIVAQAKSGPPWRISADHGKMTQGKKHIYFSGHVKIVQPAGKNSHHVTISTPSLQYFPDKKLAITDKPVSIIKPNIVIHGIGMIVDMDKNTVKLLKQTQGNYEATQNRSTNP